MKEVTKRKWFLPTLAALCALTAAACNTIAGAGKDVSATGGAVTDAAHQTQQDMNRPN